MTIESSRIRLPGLDWVRAAAALAVLLHHVDVTVTKEKYYNLSETLVIAELGYHGVDLFFLLSGFVMARTYFGQDMRGAAGAFDFAVRRAFRVFPAYVAVFVVLFCFALWTGIGAPPNIPMSAELFVSNLFLIPRDDLTTYVPVVAWTLAHEIMFYALFLTYFLSARVFVGLLVTWAAISLAFAVTATQAPGFAQVVSGLNAYFLLGVFCSWLSLRWKATSNTALAVATFLPMIVAGYLEASRLSGVPVNVYLMQACYAFSFFTIIYWMSLNILNLPKWAKLTGDYLGKLSYGIYLVHYPIIVAVTLVYLRFGMNELVFPVIAVSSIAISVVAADLLHRIVEKPGVAIGKRIVLRSGLTERAKLRESVLES